MNDSRGMRENKWKGWNGKEGPTFILGRLAKLFPKRATLFANCGIDSWILIQAMCCTFSLEFENVLLPKCSHQFANVVSSFFSLDIVSRNKQNVPMDARRHVLVSSTDYTMTKSTTNSAVLESFQDILDLDFDQYFLTQQFQLFAPNIRFSFWDTNSWLVIDFWFWFLWHEFWF